jgi:prepilin-type N-terminal cleavage/methylation domain-containing protein
MLQSFPGNRFNRISRGIKGFTLIELLIVIAIILILIAIALPNFLEAQVRAKVTKSLGELRSVGIAMEAYYLDWNLYPYESEDDCGHLIASRDRCGLSWLTSPVAYMKAIPPDSFRSDDTERWFETGIKAPHPSVALRASVTWAMWTTGPDGQDTELVSGNADGSVTWMNKIDGSADRYSATNGTKSIGDIWLWGGDSFWIGVTNGTATKPVQNVVPLIVEGQAYVHVMPPSSIGG